MLIGSLVWNSEGGLSLHAKLALIVANKVNEYVYACDSYITIDQVVRILV